MHKIVEQKQPKGLAKLYIRLVMKHFQKQIKANGLVYEFSFHAILSPVKVKYFVQAATDIERVAFEMKQVAKGKWRVIPPAPLWVFEIEQQLTELILQQHKNR